MTRVSGVELPVPVSDRRRHPVKLLDAAGQDVGHHDLGRPSGCACSSRRPAG